MSCAHPAALAFVEAPKPIPTSFAKESFFAVSAVRFTNADGKALYGRYRVLPVAGNEYLDQAAAAAKTPDFLFDEIKCPRRNVERLFALRPYLTAARNC